MEIYVAKVRFAPSPTGFIHIGNTRIALFNWLYALAHKATFILRYDDTDVERSKQTYIDAIAQDLAWLGVTPDESYFQSKRFDRYNEIAQSLKDKGLLYPCFETAQELELARKIKLTRGLPPIYDRKSLKLTPQEKADLMAKGLKPHWRFLLPNFENDVFTLKRTEVKWNDEVKGEQNIDLSSLSDPVLIREDGSYLYTFPSVIDDIDMSITHIIRGDDHLTNSAVQIAIFEALGAKLPKFAHINLLTTTKGEGLSKRSGALSIRSLRESGFEPMSIACLATLIGTSENVVAYKTMAELVKHFNLKNVSKAPAKFNVEDLPRLNAQLIQKMDFAEVQIRLTDLSISGVKATSFWEAIQPNLVKLEDAKYWWHIINDDHIRFEQVDKDFLNIAAKLLPLEPFALDSWKLWTNDIKAKTDRKGKDLFSPLRLALTGMLHGPDLSLLMPLMSRNIILNRLQN